MIAVTGANGQLGQLVINSLLEQVDAKEIVALVRNIENAQSLKSQGVEVRFADYDDEKSLNAALSGIEKLLLISSSAIGSRVPQHKAVINAAKKANVNLVVYTSILKAGSNPMVLASEHKPTEQLISDSALPAIILRNGWYNENYTQNIAGALQAGTVFGAAKEGKFFTAARADYAQAAANVLVNSDKHVGKTYELAGDNGFTLTEYAKSVSKATGQAIAYIDMSEAELIKLLQQIGLPAPYAAALADSEVQASKGWLEEGSKSLSRLIARPTTTIEKSIKQAL